MSGKVFKITIEAMPSQIPAEVRLRQLLKLALRGFDLKCRGVEFGTPDPAPSDVRQIMDEANSGKVKP